MCCNISPTFSGKFNRSCCPDTGAINLFSIGSMLGTVTSIPLSTSSSNTQSTIIPSGIISSTANLAASSPAPSHSRSKGSTIGIAVGVSVGVVVLIVASFLIYQRLRRNWRKAEQNHNVEAFELEKAHDPPMELNGQQEHELPSSGQLAHELPSSGEHEYELPAKSRYLLQELEE